MSTLANAACVRAKAGQKEEAVALLERVFARGWGKRDWVEPNPSFATCATTLGSRSSWQS
jgi:hypothetical protein